MTSPEARDLPDHFDAQAGKSTIPREDHQSFTQGLGRKHPVEWIAVGVFDGSGVRGIGQSEGEGNPAFLNHGPSEALTVNT
ncbi:hypothetical protein MLD59_02565 [Verrucomicrobiaceae bacterium E54]|nr:hypothetical protein [Verrucomicrobiaceae bacterium E54]